MSQELAPRQKSGLRMEVNHSGRSEGLGNGRILHTCPALSNAASSAVKSKWQRRTELEADATVMEPLFSVNAKMIETGQL